jgi:putative ABC transport system permease protein
VAVINQDFADRFLAGREPLGAVIALAPSSGADTDRLTEWRVVGVVETVREWGPSSFVTPMVYVPFGADPRASMSLLLRTEAEPAALLDPLRALVREVGDSPVDRVRTLASYFHETYEAQRFMLVLLGGFAALAALLAGIGLYGVMAYNVVQRRHEIGVRAALGAQRGDLLRLIVGQGAGLATVAVVLGAAGAVPIARAMSTAWMGRLLVDLHWLDPLTFAAVPLFVLATGLLASWLPALRAARVDPVTALRAEM